MFFLNPMFLWAGVALLIPPIIHLFNFRKYKTVYFSDIRFLDNIQQTTRRKSVLKQILLMLLRMFAIAALVLAFAQPVVKTMPLSTAEKQTTAPPIIYIDNSFSMQTNNNQVLAIDKAKAKALEIVDAFPQDTKFLFITNDFSQEHFRFVNSLTIREFLQNVKVSPTVRTISEVINKANQNLNLLQVPSDALKSIFLISDFQQNICDFDNIKIDSLIDINIVPIQPSEVANIAIDTCIFNTPLRRVNLQEELTVYVKNYGTNNYTNVPLTLVINGKQKSVQQFSIAAGERKQLSVKYINESNAVIKGVLSITDLPVTFDNTLYFSYQLDTTTNVLLIGQPSDNKYFSALFANDAEFNIDIVTDLTKTDLQLHNYKTVIINQIPTIPRQLTTMLHSFVSSGGNLIFVPSIKGNIADYNYLLNLLQCNALISKDTIRCNISKVDITSPLLRNAIKDISQNTDLPYITQYFNSMTNAYTHENVILETDTYKKIFTYNTYQAGRVCVFYCPLTENAGNFVTHRLFVPLIYNAVSINSNNNTAYNIVGSNNGILQKIENITETSKLYLKYSNSENEFIPRISGPDANQNYMIFAEDHATESGFYDFSIDAKFVNTFAFNYNRTESQLNYYTALQVVENLETKLLKKIKILDNNGLFFASDVVQTSTQKPLWKWFVGLAILFLVFEIIIERFLKKSFEI